ncbi:hypothetical protein JCM24511_01409 [Saitozyma sp. JCM 24511]|nr:hypothetical protein JCM24511_01409 [Saitozyma sp. JCM 24511]
MSSNATPDCFAFLRRSRGTAPVGVPPADPGALSRRSRTAHTSESALKSHYVPEPCGCSLASHDLGSLQIRDELPPYHSVREAFNKDAQETARIEILAHADSLKDLSLYLNDHPEIGYEEHKAHAKVTAYLKDQGFDVEEHYKLDTAFRASYTHGKGGRVFGLNSEYDALPGVGHACGHNLICVVGVAALIGMRAAMKKHGIDGTVVLLGTPAEEGGEGKLKLLEAGASWIPLEAPSVDVPADKGMDVCMMAHPDGQPASQHSVLPSLAIQSIWADFHGIPAQASAQPWESTDEFKGVNALDAVHLAYGAISAMRQQLHPSDRVHGIITNGGAAANIIPDLTSMKYFIRAPTATAVVALREKVIPCFEAAAKATGCKLKITTDELTYDLRNVAPLADEYAACVGDLYGTKTYINLKYDPNAALASTDFGNVTYALPSCHPNFGIPTINGRANHTYEFAKAARSDEAHEEAWKAATGLACVGLRVIADGAFARECRKWWEEDHKGEEM